MRRREYGQRKRKAAEIAGYSIFKVREVFALTNQLGNFFRFVRSFFEIFQKTFFDHLSGIKKPLSHHRDVIGAEIEKAR